MAARARDTQINVIASPQLGSTKIGPANLKGITLATAFKFLESFGSEGPYVPHRELIHEEGGAPVHVIVARPKDPEEVGSGEGETRKASTVHNIRFLTEGLPNDPEGEGLRMKPGAILAPLETAVADLEGVEAERGVVKYHQDSGIPLAGEPDRGASGVRGPPSSIPIQGRSRPGSIRSSPRDERQRCERPHSTRDPETARSGTEVFP